MSREAVENEYFCVECSNDPEAEEAVVCKYFQTRQEALDFAQSYLGRLRCIWVSERGEYGTRNDSTRTTWIYFWWTPATDYGQMAGDGWGIPEGNSGLVEYDPLAPDSRLLLEKSRELKRKAKVGGDAPRRKKTRRKP